MADRDKQLTELKKSAGDNEELKKQIEKLEAENKTASEAYQAKLTDTAINTAIKLAVAGEVHDPDLVTTLLDKSKIEVNADGSVKSGMGKGYPPCNTKCTQGGAFTFSNQVIMSS